MLVAARGRHPDTLTRDDCWSCHPVGTDGTGHGQRIYPVDDPFAPGNDCAAGCHDWLATRVAETSPAAARYRGTLRPGELLAAAGNPHGAIWRDGWRRPEDDRDYVVQAVAPGCGGCHGVDDVSHGATPDCLRCHDWDGPDDAGGEHSAHMGYVAAVGGAAAGMTDGCGWCHGFATEDGATVARPACYNCHLSGHAPLGDNGRPQLWR